jgi:methylated-DNA-[protein]-cysteine S-methyltransferase
VGLQQIKYTLTQYFEYHVKLKGFGTEGSGAMESVNIQYKKTRIGDLIIGAYKSRLCLLDFRYRKLRKSVDRRIQSGLRASYLEREDDVITETLGQLAEYLEGQRDSFSIPLLKIGTPFQEKVWDALLEIPYGETISYMGLAGKLGDTKTVRAVASANGANAISIIIPCHRVIGSNGQLVGYGGGLGVKKKLLLLEQQSGLQTETTRQSTMSGQTQFVFE